MGNPAKMVTINCARIRELLAERGKTMTSVAAEMGMSRSFLPDAMRRAIMKPLKAEQLAKLLGVPLSEIAVPEPEPQPQPEPQAAQTEVAQLPEPVKETPAELARVYDALWCINHNLEQLVKSFRPASIRLTPVEDCCLLLAAMTCYGHCLEGDFLNKAKELGFDADTIRTAKDLAGVKTKIYNDHKWLERRA